MKNLLVVIVVIVAGIAAFGFYRGWFRVSTGDADVTISVDKDKFGEDEKKLKDAGASLKKPGSGKTTPDPDRRP
jgi:hypothetical protein